MSGDATLISGRMLAAATPFVTRGCDVKLRPRGRFLENVGSLWGMLAPNPVIAVVSVEVEQWLDDGD